LKRSHRNLRRGSLLALVLLLTVTATCAKSTMLTLQVDNRTLFTTWVKGVIERFEQENPDLKVDLWVPTGSLLEQITVRIAAGMPFDIGLHDPYAILDFARQGILEDLMPYVQRDAAHFEDWYPPALEMTRFRGGLYSLPRDLQFYGVYYNVDAYAEVGLARPDADWTYDRLASDSKRLVKQDAQGNTLRFGFMLPRWRSWVIPVWAFGGDFVDSWTDPTRFTGFAENTLRGLNFLREFAETGAMTPTNKPVSELNAFVQQRMAIGMSNTIDMDTYRNIADFTWDVAAMPIGPNGRTTVINALGWFMLSTSPHKDEAWKLMRYLTSQESFTELIKTVGVIPPERRLAMNVWVPYSDRPEHRHLFLTDADLSIPYIGALPKAVYDPIEREGHALVFGQKAPSVALEHMEQSVMAAIASYGN
jgi:multiple sugar transport system substrate-binding protein